MAGPTHVPLGLLRGYAERDFPSVRVEVVNFGCAACHSGVTYDSQGSPRREAWVGLPNTSINLDGLTAELLQALRGAATERPGRLEAALDTLYPVMSSAERETLTQHVLPRLAGELRDRETTWGGSTPYAPGGPGSANGLGAIAHVLSDEDGPPDGVSVSTPVQIPDLGDRMMKSSLAVDGTFGPAGRARFRAMTHADLTEDERNGKAGILAFFAVPTMGLDPKRVPDLVPRARELVDFLAAYRPPTFPGPVDTTLAGRGEAVYGRKCAVCHGVRAPLTRSSPILTEFPNVVVPVEVIGTDPMRWQAATPSLAAEILATPAGDLLSVSPTEGYMAPPLTGVWATAPYLHNGSVPTLWHLMHPEARPDRFEVGGHRLDYVRMGIDLVPDESGVFRYPHGYVPWSSPVVYDTARPGQGNLGHEAQFRALTEAEKSALIEYLKLL